jgi:regulator of cell morphogenesis and NO signaling
VEITRRKITDLIEENYVYAYVLYYLGIQFYEYSGNTLEQVCVQKGLNVRQVVQSLEAVGGINTDNQIPLDDLPIDLIIEYLKHTHYLFVRRKLPYVVRLIEKLDVVSTPLARDLQIVFPLFVEDFIGHIHEEEDTFFRYIALLQQAKYKRVNQGQLYFGMEKHSVQRFAMEHDTHDDEMQGLRTITNDYACTPSASQHLKVILLELQAFECELQVHARIENEVLFPKALRLEREVKEIVSQAAKLN